jgi:hypothetical protein
MSSVIFGVTTSRYLLYIPFGRASHCPLRSPLRSLPYLLIIPRLLRPGLVVSPFPVGFISKMSPRRPPRLLLLLFPRLLAVWLLLPLPFLRPRVRCPRKCVQDVIHGFPFWHPNGYHWGPCDCGDIHPDLPVRPPLTPDFPLPGQNWGLGNPTMRDL